MLLTTPITVVWVEPSGKNHPRTHRRCSQLPTGEIPRENTGGHAPRAAGYAQVAIAVNASSAINLTGQGRGKNMRKTLRAGDSVSKYRTAGQRTLHP